MKLSLHIGINNYPGTGSDLAGCVNDARDMMYAAQRLGYDTSKMLIDEQATKTAIMDLLTEMVVSLKYQDELLVSYSGHGTTVPDRDGDEVDGRDEAWCPYDIMSVGALTDDDLYNVFRFVRHGARAVMFADSCHAGTLQRFAPAITPSPRRAKWLPPAVWAGNDDVNALERVIDQPARGVMRKTALVMAACLPTEVTYDTVIDGRACGIYTYVALDVLSRSAPQTYRAWHRGIRDHLPSGDYPTHPMINGTSQQRGWSIA